MVPACQIMPSTPGEGEVVRRGIGCCVVARPDDRPAAPSSQGEGLLLP
jgi:hypothetical protein